MVYLLRALFIGVPLAIILAGTHANSSNPQAEPEHWAAAERMPENSVVLPATTEDMDRVHRIALKQETAADLLTGAITFADALERFRQFAEGSANDVQLAKQVVLFAKVAAYKHSTQYAAVIAQIEAEANAIAAAN